VTDAKGETPTAAGPALVVVHGGEPSAHELAALVVALGAMTPGPPDPHAVAGRWADRRAMLRRPLGHGPGRWVASSRPSG
jgi:hypothetical protein